MPNRNLNRGNFAEWNEEMARKYDPEKYHAHPSPVVRFIERKRCRIMKKMCVRSAHSSVVDLGCGAGNLIPHLDGFDYLGIDLSEYILSKAGKRLRANAFIVRADVLSLPLRSGSVPLATCSEVLEHVLEPKQLLAELDRVLSDDGAAVVSVPNEKLIDSLKSVFLRVRKSGGSGYRTPAKMTDEWHLTGFDKRVFHSLARERFRVVKTAGVPSALLPLRYVFLLKKRVDA